MKEIYQFRDKSLLNSALTHPSAQTHISKHLFEHLEFLGDRILALAVANMLYDKHFDSIKTLASKHAKLVSTECLEQIALQWNIPKILKHEIESLSKKVLADAVEAIIGAIYLDSDYATAQEVVQTYWKQFLNIQAIEAKMELQEFAQSKGLMAEYSTIDERGADHNKIYIVEVSLANFGKATGKGSSKHAASKEAAKNMLSRLKNGK